MNISRLRNSGVMFYIGLMETIKPTLRQLISTGEKILIDEVTQMGLIESCIVKMGALRRTLG